MIFLLDIIVGMLLVGLLIYCHRQIGKLIITEDRDLLSESEVHHEK